MRRAIVTVLSVFVAIALSICAYGWHIVHRALPQLDGEIQISGLQQEVTVMRDVRGVPHIRAQNKQDLYFAQGYVMAQDRLWQMDVLRRASAGELSEIFGSATVAIDRRFRVLGFRAAAERDALNGEPAFRADVEAFARGVNQFIDTHQSELPFEFTLLRYKPRRWEPADTLLIVAYMYESLSSSWRWDLNRARVAPKLGPERAAFFYDQSSPYDRPIVGASPQASQTSRVNLPRLGDDESQHQRIAAAPTGVTSISDTGYRDLQTQQSSTPENGLWSVAQSILDHFDDGVRSGIGSNNWVVSGAHTASGKPLLANDTHLMLGVPDIWYLIQLSAPGFNAEGFALPGTPNITIGHNDRIAWGFTNDGADVQDLYAEDFNPANPLEYRAHDAWQSADVRHEVIHVKGSADETMDVVITRHGPIVEREGAVGYALKWTALEPGGLSHSYFDLASANNWEEFRGRLRDVVGPAQNAVYADVYGHIGFIVAAHIPTRACKNWPPPNSAIQPGTPCGAIPAPGNTDDYEWTGYIPFDDLPQILDPPSGIIATANGPVVGPGYHQQITWLWMPPWRSDRIFKLLSEKSGLTPQDFARIETDIVSESNQLVAQSLVRALPNASPHDPRTADLIRGLASWDGRMNADSVDAAFADQTARAIERNLLHPYLRADTPLVYPSGTVFLDRVLRERPQMWLPKEFQNYDQLLIVSADLAIAELTAETQSADVNSWKWGARNALLMAHPIGQTGILRRLLSIGPMPQDGATDVVKAAGHSFGPSMRFVADLSDWDSSFMEITTGESGQYGSAHYRDQFPSWFSGQPLPAPYSAAAQQSSSSHTLHLVPAR
jgi:penicillin amidase